LEALLYLYFRALRALLVVLALVCLARSSRAEPTPSPEARATAAAGPDRDAMLSFSISSYLLAPAKCLGSFASHGVACAAPGSGGLRLDETGRDAAETHSVVFPAFARRLTFERFVELGGFVLPRTDLPIDLGALALELAARMRIRWVLAGMVHVRAPLPFEGPHGVSIHPLFGTVSGGATVGLVATF
jgi:hypothetical protein